MAGPDRALLAELDAGLLDPARAGEVRAAALADPRAAAVLDALRVTRAELAALPAPALPPAVAQRWSDALEAERTAPPRHAPVPRHRPVIARPVPVARRPLVALLAAAVIVGALTVGGLFGGRDGRLDVTRVGLAAVARSTIGQTDLGPLTDPARRGACLRTAGHPDAEVLGGLQVRFDGVPGVLLVLPTGDLGRFRVLIVDEACRTLTDDVVG